MSEEGENAGECGLAWGLGGPGRCGLLAHLFSRLCFFLLKVECRGGNERKMLIHRGEASEAGGRHRAGRDGGKWSTQLCVRGHGSLRE